MKKLFAALALVAPLALPTLTLAQDGGDGPGTEQNGGEGDRPRGERGERGDRGGRGGRGGFGLDPERLKEDLGLNDEQVAKMKEVAESMQGLREELRELFRSGNMEAARERMQGLRTEMEGKMKEILTPEQWEKMQESGMGRMFGGGRGRRGEDGGEGGPGFGRGGQGRGQGRARLRDEAVKALALGEEEAAVVLPMLDTVLNTRETLMREGQERRDAFLKTAREETDPQALAAALEAFRKAKAEDQAQLAASQEQLREVLTLEQEAKLVALNVLD